MPLVLTLTIGQGDLLRKNSEILLREKKSKQCVLSLRDPTRPRISNLGSASRDSKPKSSESDTRMVGVQWETRNWSTFPVSSSNGAFDRAQSGGKWWHQAIGNEAIVVVISRWVPYLTKILGKKGSVIQGERSCAFFTWVQFHYIATHGHGIS